MSRSAKSDATLQRDPTLAFDSRRQVPDFSDHLTRWAEWSTHVRRRPNASLDLYYGPDLPHDPARKLDFFPAPLGRHGEAPPLLVFLHGGDWRDFDKAEHAFAAAAWPGHGVSVAVPNYQLCPDVPLQQIVLQLIDCIVWLYRHAQRRGYDRNRIHLAGHGAGAHLAAMLSTVIWPLVAVDLPADLIKSATLISGVYDLQPLLANPACCSELGLKAGNVLPLSPAYLTPPPHLALITAVGALEPQAMGAQTALLGQRWQPNLHAALTVADCHHFSVLPAIAEPTSRLFQTMLPVLHG